MEIVAKIIYKANLEYIYHLEVLMFIRRQVISESNLKYSRHKTKNRTKIEQKTKTKTKIQRFHKDPISINCML